MTSCKQPTQLAWVSLQVDLGPITVDYQLAPHSLYIIVFLGEPYHTLNMPIIVKLSVVLLFNLVLTQYVL